MKAFTIYRRDSGQIVGHYTGSPRQLARNVPADCASVPGRYDPKSRRIDTKSGEPIDWTPPEDAGRRSRDAKRRIAALEAQGVRPMRELLADPSNAEARQRVEAIEAEIAELRKVLG